MKEEHRRLTMNSTPSIPLRSQTSLLAPSSLLSDAKRPKTTVSRRTPASGGPSSGPPPSRKVYATRSRVRTSSAVGADKQVEEEEEEEEEEELQPYRVDLPSKIPEFNHMGVPKNPKDVQAIYQCEHFPPLCACTLTPTI